VILCASGHDGTVGAFGSAYKRAAAKTGPFATLCAAGVLARRGLADLPRSLVPASAD